MRPVLTSIAAFLLTLSAAWSAAASDIERIDVHFGWFGLGPRVDERVRIQSNADGTFTATGRNVTNAMFSQNKTTTDFPAVPVAPSLIDQFQNAVLDKPWSIENLVSRLATPEWLQAQASRAYESETRCSPEAREFFYANFRDPKRIAAALKDIGRHTDDYPGVDVTVRLKTGRVIRLGSDAQIPLMLPWEAVAGKTWNARISQTLSSMLPTASTFRKRLAEDGFGELLYERVLNGIRDHWADLEMRCAHRVVLAIVETKFQTLRLYENMDSLAGYLRRSDMPPNFAVSAVIDGAPTAAAQNGARQFLRDIDGYIALALPFARSHPEIKLTLWYSDGQSFVPDEPGDGPDAEHLAKMIAPFEKQAAFLMEHDYFFGRRWVVLPDGTVHLWSNRPPFDSKRTGPDW